METPFSHYTSMGKRYTPVHEHNMWSCLKEEECKTVRSQWSDLAKIRTRPRFYACPRYLPILKGSDQKQLRKGGDIVFPVISQWGLSVAMETSSDPIRPKTLCSLFPHPNDATNKT